MRLLITFLILSFTAQSQLHINGTGTPVKVNKTGTSLGINRITGNEVELYILAGQSNVGRARVSEMTSEEAALYSGAIANTKILNPYLSATAVYDMNVGTNTMLADMDNMDEFGLEASLFKSFPQNKTRYLLKYGDGNTSMQAFWSALANRIGWENLKEYTRNIVDVIIADGKIPVMKGFIWMQGESDAASESFANNYGWRLQGCHDDFEVLWDSILTANSLPPQEYKWVVGRIKLTAALYDDTLRANQANFCNDPANNAVLIDTDPYPLRDPSHYSASGQIQFGLDVYDALNGLFFLSLLGFKKLTTSETKPSRNTKKKVMEI